MRTVYLDVLVLLNIYVTYFLLKAAARLTHRRLKAFRHIISAMTGGLFSLVILLPDMGAAGLLLKLLTAIIVSFAAFGGESVKAFFTVTVVYFGVSFVFAGVMLGIWTGFRPGVMYYSNGTAYFDISLGVLCISTIISYAAVSIFRRILDSKNAPYGEYCVTVMHEGRCSEIPALADTGNGLADPISGRPVVICPRDRVENLLTENTKTFILPYFTISGESTITVFRPDTLYIKGERGIPKPVDALCGICGGIDRAIFNPNILL